MSVNDFIEKSTVETLKSHRLGMYAMYTFFCDKLEQLFQNIPENVSDEERQHIMEFSSWMADQMYDLIEQGKKYEECKTDEELRAMLREAKDFHVSMGSIEDE